MKSNGSNGVLCVSAAGVDVTRHDMLSGVRFLSGCVMGVTQNILCSKTDSATAAALRAHRRALSYTYRPEYFLN